MPRYDAGWGPPRGPGHYDRPFPPPPPQGPRGFGPGGPRRPGIPREDFRPHPGWGGHVDRERMPDDSWTMQGDEDVGVDFDDALDGGAIYGPARYGLGPYHHRLRKRQRPDAELKSGVEEALFYDTWVDAEAITVEVADGVVTLTGELPDYEEIRYATDDAWDVEGVRGVRTRLRIRGEGGEGSAPQASEGGQQ